MKVFGVFNLSDAGRKAALLAGVCDEQVQAVEVTRDAPEFAGYVGDGEPTEYRSRVGTAVIEGGDLVVRGGKFDHVPTLVEILAAARAKKADYAQAKATKDAADRAEVLAVFAARKVVIRADSYGYGPTEAKYETHHAAWPQPDSRAAEVAPEVTAWLAELSAANEAAKEAASKTSGALKASKEAADAAARDRAARRPRAV